MKTRSVYCLIVIFSSFVPCFAADPGDDAPDVKMRKVKDIVIYEDANYYCAFPSVIRRPDGELLVAFRRAPNRRLFGEKEYSHVDQNSYLVMVRSTDAENWSEEPELIYAHPFGGSQDPCLLQLNDGTLLCTSYGWTSVKEDGLKTLKKPFLMVSGAVFRSSITLTKMMACATLPGRL